MRIGVGDPALRRLHSSRYGSGSTASGRPGSCKGHDGAFAAGADGLVGRR